MGLHSVFQLLVPNGRACRPTGDLYHWIGTVNGDQQLQIIQIIGSLNSVFLSGASDIEVKI